MTYLDPEASARAEGLSEGIREGIEQAIRDVEHFRDNLRKLKDNVTNRDRIDLLNRLIEVLHKRHDTYLD